MEAAGLRHLCRATEVEVEMPQPKLQEYRLESAVETQLVEAAAEAENAV